MNALKLTTQTHQRLAQYEPPSRTATALRTGTALLEHNLAAVDRAVAEHYGQVAGFVNACGGCDAHLAHAVRRLR